MAVKFEATDYKKITLDEMLDFIEANQEITAKESKNGLKR